jgi:hypothetical protein
MKTLAARFRLLVFGVTVIVAVVSCCNFFVPDTKTFAELGHGRRERTYVPWKSQTKFDEALKQVCDHGATYYLKVKLDNGTTIEPYHPKGSKDCTDPNLENIRTVKVTKSKAADDIAAGGSAVNDPHATYRIQSANPSDIVTVLDALEHK